MIPRINQFMTRFLITPKIPKDYMVLWLFNIITMFRRNTS